MWSCQQYESQSSDPNVAEALLTVSFRNIDWPFLQSVYGWAALQYQAWARGYINIEPDSIQNVVLYTDSVLEFWVDDKHYFGGDFYSYRRAPLVLHLERGNHRIDLRLIRDVRAMGAVGDPDTSIQLKAEVSHDTLKVDEEKLLVSDVVDGFLASPFASVPVCNNSGEWINIWSVVSVIVRSGIIIAALYSLMDYGGSIRSCYARGDPVQAGTRPIEVPGFPSV